MYTTETLAETILAEWDFCAETSDATREARREGMSEVDICKALALAGAEWERCKNEARA